MLYNYLTTHLSCHFFHKSKSCTSNIFKHRFSLQQRKHSKMSEPKKYFINSSQDYQGGSVHISESHWKSQLFQIVNTIENQQPPSVKDGEGGLYVGSGGIAYMFFYLSQHPVFKEEGDELLNHGLNYIKAAVAYADSHKTQQKSAFLLGNAGTYAVAAAMYHATGDKSKAEQYRNLFIEAAATCKPLNFLRCGSDEFLVGRAGYLCAALWLEKVIGKGTVQIDSLHEICRATIKSGRLYAKRYRSPCPLMYKYYDMEYLGAAHGLSSILQMLMSVPDFLHSDASIERDVKATVDYLLSLQLPSGNFPSAMDEIGDRARPISMELVHWCHGAPGVVYMMVKAYLQWKDDKYLKSALTCGELVWTKGLLKKGPGICHGVAGSGYVFLLLYRLTSDPKHLHRANVFAQFMFTPEFKQGARTPDCPHSLYEGLAGTVCFLTDLLKPDQAAFPFQDVF